MTAATGLLPLGVPPTFVATIGVADDAGEAFAPLLRTAVGEASSTPPGEPSATLADRCAAAFVPSPVDLADESLPVGGAPARLGPPVAVPLPLPLALPLPPTPDPPLVEPSASERGASDPRNGVPLPAGLGMTCAAEAEVPPEEDANSVVGGAEPDEVAATTELMTTELVTRDADVAASAAPPEEREREEEVLRTDEAPNAEPLAWVRIVASLSPSPSPPRSSPRTSGAPASVEERSAARAPRDVATSNRHRPAERAAQGDPLTAPPAAPASPPLPLAVLASPLPIAGVARSSTVALEPSTSSGARAPITTMDAPWLSSPTISAASPPAPRSLPGAASGGSSPGLRSGAGAHGARAAAEAGPSHTAQRNASDVPWSPVDLPPLGATASSGAATGDATVASVPRSDGVDAPSIPGSPDHARVETVEVAVDAARISTATTPPADAPGRAGVRDAKAATAADGNDVRGDAPARFESEGTSEVTYTAAPETSAAVPPAGAAGRAVLSDLVVEAPRAGDAAGEPGRPTEVERLGASRRRQEAAERGANRMTARNAVVSAVDVPELGHVRVDAHSRGQSVDVSIVVERAEAAVIIEDSRSALERELRRDGVRVGSVEVRTESTPDPGTRDDRRSPRREHASADTTPNRAEESRTPARAHLVPTAPGRRVRIVL